MRAGTLFSGIGAPECARQDFDWRFCAEIDRFASTVHHTHFPHVPNLGDVSKVDWSKADAVDLLVFGSPCQSFSVAGRRLGLADPRGNLALVALQVVDALKPAWFVFENVPGLLSLDYGDAFASWLKLVDQLGYSGAWGSLDAQYFGVAQRRNRVFFVGHSGDWRGPAAVLSLSEGMSWNPPPRRKAGKAVAALTANGVGTCGADDNQAQAGHLVAFGGNDTRGPINVSAALNAHGGPCGRMDFESETFIAHSLRGEGFDASEDGTGRGTPLVPVCFSSKDRGADASLDLAPCLRAGVHDKSHANAGVPPAIAVSLRGRDGGATAELSEVPSALRASQGGGDKAHVLTDYAVRRLTPLERERLQGFPDYWTDVPYRGKPAADGPRYRAIGNSMAVPVMKYLLDRIEQFHLARQAA